MNTSTTAATATVIDPVCGMTVDPAQAVGSSRYNGEAFHFCSRGCETKFDADPARYASGDPAARSSCCSPGGSCH